MISGLKNGRIILLTSLKEIKTLKRVNFECHAFADVGFMQMLNIKQLLSIP